MAIQQFGNPNYVFGFSDADAAAIAAAIGLTPQEGSISIEPEVAAEGKDKMNRTVALALDDQGKKTFQLSGYVSNSTLFNAAMGQTFTYAGLTYIVMAPGKSFKKDDFVMGNISATNWSQITTSSKTLVSA